MKLELNDPPRTFRVGPGGRIEMKDCAHIQLAADEQVTLVTESGAEYDVARKSWGFYATPSLNGRLKNFGLRGALVKSPHNLFYIFLVEQDKESELYHYLELEEHVIISWLDHDQALTQIERYLKSESVSVLPNCLFCDSNIFATIFTYTEPPEGEIRFKFSRSTDYHRQVYQCERCAHLVSIHDMDDHDLYSDEYVNANYQDAEGIKRTFERIIKLPPEKSDNSGRVARILEFAHHHFPSAILEKPPTILDIGAGLGVFPYKIKEAGWQCTALDPDNRSVNHIQQVVGVEAIQADFMSVQNVGRFDVITFNKVLEHVEDPIKMLAKSADYLQPGGFVYVEVPDGEVAMKDGPRREEFFIDHPHIFSLTSLALLAKRSKFTVKLIERLQEPSTKYTLCAFLMKE